MDSNQRQFIWLLGNGGSASTVEHFETDLAFLRIKNTKATLPYVSAITSNSALVTAAANDISYDEVFKTILMRRVKTGDVLICVSASGNSENLIRAVEFAKQVGIFTFSLLGFDGGALKNLSDEVIHIVSPIGEYGIVEDVHLSIFHAVSAEISKKIVEEKAN